ncbi:MAG: S8 family serine peptidase [Saprospiraceae bacterium]
MRLRIFLIIIIFNAYKICAQDIIENEFIIQLKSEAKSFTSFQTSLRSSAIESYWNISKSPLHLYTVKFSDSTKAKSWVQSMSLHADVLGIYPNHRIKPRKIPNDPGFTNQWQYINTGTNNGKVGADMDMDLAWNLATGGMTPDGDTIVVCVVDDGLNGSHPDMQGNIWFNYNEIPQNGIDDDENGYIDDFKGYNVELDNDDVLNSGVHGTSVSGIIGAKGNNGIGVSGINWNVKIMVVDYDIADEAHALAAYAYPYQMRKLYNESNGKKGAFVVATNSSWGSDNLFAKDAPLWCNMYDSLGKVGILNVGATANDNIDVDFYGDMPTSCESEFLISVTNVNNKDVKVGNAGYGRKSIDLGSFGNQAYTLTSNDYGIFAGTSSATPHVTGVVALAYSLPCMELTAIAKTNPSEACLILKDLLLNGTTYNESLQNVSTTSARINAHKALENVSALCGNCAPPAGITFEQKDKSISIHWATNTSNTTVKTRYRSIDELGWTEIANIQTGFTIQNLNNCTEYEIQISNNCGNFVNGNGYSKFIKTNGCCEAPSTISTVAIADSITISWAESPNTDYEVHMRPFDGAWSVFTVDTNEVVLKDLLFCSQLEVSITSLCRTYDEVSLPSPTQHIYTSCGSCLSRDYCSFNSKDNAFEWIDTLHIAGDIYPIGQSQKGYELSSGQNTSILEKGKSYAFSAKIGYKSSVFPEYLYIYADWNQDGIFGIDELSFSSSESTQNVISGEIEVPITSLSGVTRFRVMMSYEILDSPCDKIDFTYGHIADICIIIADENCLNLTQTTFQVNHDNSVTFKNPSNNSTLILYRDSTELLWKKASFTGAMTINDIDSCTVLQFKTAEICTDNFSTFSEEKNIKTDCINNTQDTNNKISKIFPNPASSQIILVSDIQPYEIVAIDITGKSSILHFDKAGTSIVVSIHTLLDGFYILSVKSKLGKNLYFPFIKQN